MHCKNHLIILATTILFSACQSNSSSGKNTDNKQDTTVKQPFNSSAHTATQKCFTNQGLKFNATVTLNMDDRTVTGNVSTEDEGSGQKTSTSFEGSRNKDTLIVRFKGTPPMVGDASEWTDKPWFISHANGKESLGIIFNAKNYQTSKWEMTTYTFDPCGTGN
jgi:hypothetical protein